ncbi:hypothetical protein FCM35_KLT19829 [Carex littledalei]|uniref:Uncharacterized protein n=1 Tax=Carex littledalei TaxID=544730 RepID=A0A833VDK4_9POAL|nr:hypothetical protein FCM35_KLT19829 [Carex littledalei]
MRLAADTEKFVGVVRSKKFALTLSFLHLARQNSAAISTILNALSSLHTKIFDYCQLQKYLILGYRKVDEEDLEAIAAKEYKGAIAGWKGGGGEEVRAASKLFSCFSCKDCVFG